MAVADVKQRLREACADVISASWAKGKRDCAQAASDFLDAANALLEAPDEPGRANTEETSAQATVSVPSRQPAVAAQRPFSEPFFLSTGSTEGCLTLQIDSALMHSLESEAQLPGRRGGWPLGKRRTGDGTFGPAAGWWLRLQCVTLHHLVRSPACTLCSQAQRLRPLGTGVAAAVGRGSAACIRVRRLSTTPWLAASALLTRHFCAGACLTQA